MAIVLNKDNPQMHEIGYDWIQEIENNLPDHFNNARFTNTSWGNDACDSATLEIKSLGVTFNIWFDYDDPERREIDCEGKINIYCDKTEDYMNAICVNPIVASVNSFQDMAIAIENHIFKLFLQSARFSPDLGCLNLGYDGLAGYIFADGDFIIHNRDAKTGQSISFEVPIDRSDFTFAADSQSDFEEAAHFLFERHSIWNLLNT